METRELISYGLSVLLFAMNLYGMRNTTNKSFYYLYMAAASLIVARVLFLPTCFVFRYADFCTFDNFTFTNHLSAAGYLVMAMPAMIMFFEPKAKVVEEETE